MVADATEGFLPTLLRVILAPLPLLVLYLIHRHQYIGIDARCAGKRCPALFLFEPHHRVCDVAGKLKPAAAFMTGKMKLSGDMGKAMKLDKLMGKLKSKL